jgi:regulator of sirC expression with transglutaminase-like and TPR domain
LHRAVSARYAGIGMDRQRKSPRERFVELARRPDAEVNLGEAALLIAAEAYEGLDIDHYLGRLDRLAAEAKEHLGNVESETERIARLNRFLFVEKGFVGNQEDYYDRRNSFLNEVLDRHVGIPITLSLVYIEVARRLGLAVAGVGFPGHFLVKYLGKQELIIDAFFGLMLSERDCHDRLKSVLGERASFDRRYLQSATAKEILIRMLRNLKQIHVNAEQFEAALPYCDRVLLLDPNSAHELRDRGLIYQKLECYGAALADLERFLALAPHDETAATIREDLVLVRREAAKIH